MRFILRRLGFFLLTLWAALTLNFIRSLIDGGFADLHHPEYWDLDFVQHSPLASEYG